MTDPMELAGRLDRIAEGAFPYTASVAAEAAACIREMVEALAIAEASMDGRCISAHRIGLNTVRRAIGNGTRAAIPPAPGAEA